MTKEDIFTLLDDNNLLSENKHLILVDGFEKAFLGVSATIPSRAIYDYWVCMDLLVRRDGLDFDDAMDDLDEFISQDLGEQTPIYIKPV